MNEFERIKNKYPNRIPIIVKKKKDSELPDIDKSKFLVQKDMIINQFIYIIRKKINLKPNEAIFVTINNQICMSNQSISEIYEKHKNDDGFLYIIYSSENTFG